MELRYHWIPADPSVFDEGRHDRPILSCILHSTDGRCAGDIATLTGHDTHKVSVHWYTTRTGDIYHFVANADRAYHAGNVKDPKFDNFHSIGIEQEHFDGQEDWPQVQIEATALVYAFLTQQYPGITPAHHSQVAAPAGRKQDPVAFPSDRFWTAVGNLDGQAITAVQI